jgi:GNAT superfamily N-acetyltransferase
MSTNGITLRPVRSKRERRLFALFPWRIYKDDPLWVPPILSERLKRMDPQSPLIRRGEADFFVAWRAGKPVGTIGTAIDTRADGFQGVKTAIFGFFECYENEVVARALLDHARSWAQERGADRLEGPRSFSNNNEPGLLIEGRGTSPGLMMGWTPPYFVDFVEGYGFRKYRDALAYRLYMSHYADETGKIHPPERVRRVADFARRRYGYTVRPADIDDWDRELETARQIYNRSLATLPDFVPMEQDEWMDEADGLRPLLTPDLVVFAEVEGQPVGFGIGLPDVSQALLHANGLRYPWDYLKLWWHSRHLPGVSFKIMAMLPEYWGRGIDALIYHEIAKGVVRGGYEWVDLSLTGETNPMTNKLVLRAGATLDKRYRVYELPLKEAPGASD